MRRRIGEHFSRGSEESEGRNRKRKGDGNNRRNHHNVNDESGDRRIKRENERGEKLRRPPNGFKSQPKGVRGVGCGGVKRKKLEVNDVDLRKR